MSDNIFPFHRRELPFTAMGTYMVIHCQKALRKLFWNWIFAPGTSLRSTPTWDHHRSSLGGALSRQRFVVESQFPKSVGRVVLCCSWLQVPFKESWFQLIVFVAFLAAYHSKIQVVRVVSAVLPQCFRVALSSFLKVCTSCCKSEGFNGWILVLSLVLAIFVVLTPIVKIN